MIADVLCYVAGVLWLALIGVLMGREPTGRSARGIAITSLLLTALWMAIGWHLAVRWHQ